MRTGWLLAVLVLVGCDRDDGDAAVPDARTDGSAAVMDAPFSCMPVAPVAPGPACLALADFGAGDCITISSAHVTWTGACGEQLTAQFSYPVVETGSGRRVTGSFDTDARLELRPPGMAAREDVVAVHVDVTTWQEGQDMHDIDITLTITDARYALPPLRITGTFCDWPYYLC
jgi:hypothetical protein